MSWQIDQNEMTRASTKRGNCNCHGRSYCEFTKGQVRRWAGIFWSNSAPSKRRSSNKRRSGHKSNKREPASISKPKEKTTQPLAATPEQVCRATIAALMGRDPEIIKVSKVEAGIVHLGYVRPNDGSRWQQRCRIEGNKVIWATETGRWRDHVLDSTVTFAMHQKSGELEIDEDGNKTRYKLSRLK